MSDVNIEVSKSILVELDYEQYNLDEDQAEALLELLADALGKKVSA
jgi:hypothetical protein